MIETVILPRGARVLAKPYKGHFAAKTYANNTQAQRALDTLTAQGIRAHIWHPRLGPVRYIIIEETQEEGRA